MHVCLNRWMVVNQGRQFHQLHLFEQKRNVVNPLSDNVLDFIHDQSLAQSSI